jgi:hypothetical protein
MKYYFDFGFADKQHVWYNGEHKQERYKDGKQAFARYIEIQRNGKKAEQDLKAKNLLPEDYTFECTIDIFKDDDEYCLEASLAFFYDAFQVLNAEHKAVLE